MISNHSLVINSCSCKHLSTTLLFNNHVWVQANLWAVVCHPGSRHQGAEGRYSCGEPCCQARHGHGRCSNDTVRILCITLLCPVWCGEVWQGQAKGRGDCWEECSPNCRGYQAGQGGGGIILTASNFNINKLMNFANFVLDSVRILHTLSVLNSFHFFRGEGPSKTTKIV